MGAAARGGTSGRAAGAAGAAGAAAATLARASVRGGVARTGVGRGDGGSGGLRGALAAIGAGGAGGAIAGAGARAPGAGVTGVGVAARAGAVVGAGPGSLVRTGGCSGSVVARASGRGGVVAGRRPAARRCRGGRAGADGAAGSRAAVDTRGVAGAEVTEGVDGAGGAGSAGGAGGVGGAGSVDCVVGPGLPGSRGARRSSALTASVVSAGGTSSTRGAGRSGVSAGGAGGTTESAPPSLIRAPRPYGEPPRAVNRDSRRARCSSRDSAGSDAPGPTVTSGCASALSGSPNSHSKLAGPSPRASGVRAVREPPSSVWEFGDGGGIYAPAAPKSWRAADHPAVRDRAAASRVDARRSFGSRAASTRAPSPYRLAGAARRSARRATARCRLTLMPPRRPRRREAFRLGQEQAPVPMLEVEDRVERPVEVMGQTGRLRKQGLRRRPRHSPRRSSSTSVRSTSKRWAQCGQATTPTASPSEFTRS